MIFGKRQALERVDRRRPCEVDGSKAWYHGLVQSDHTFAQPDSTSPYRDSTRLSRVLRSGQILPPSVRVYVERRTYAMVEYLDGSVAKVDPEQVHFIDI